ncbi:hypothetical protein GWO43_26555 [candidate division KSB1 bacterium]|nr:hypothetical protein [candidate division KSB1 bacterium]NIX74043.1 hypothetical protein [candidate division KSB1 bacterium]
MSVPSDTTDVAPDAGKAPKSGPKPDSFLAKLLRFLVRGPCLGQNNGRTRGWGD